MSFWLRTQRFLQNAILLRRFDRFHYPVRFFCQLRFAQSRIRFRQYPPGFLRIREFCHRPFQIGHRLGITAQPGQNAPPRIPILRVFRKLLHHGLNEFQAAFRIILIAGQEIHRQIIPDEWHLRSQFVGGLELPAGGNPITPLTRIRPQ